MIAAKEQDLVPLTGLIKVLVLGNGFSDTLLGGNHRLTGGHIVDLSPPYPIMTIPPVGFLICDGVADYVVCDQKPFCLSVDPAGYLFKVPPPGYFYIKGHGNKILNKLQFIFDRFETILPVLLKNENVPGDLLRQMVARSVIRNLKRISENV